MTLSPLSALGLVTTRPNAITLALCVVLLSSGHSALAQFSGEPPYVVPAAVFDLDGAPGTDYYFSFGGGYLYPQGTGLTCFHAPVYLPNSFRIGELVVHAYDGGAEDLTVELDRVEVDSFGNTHTEILANVASSGNSGIQRLSDDSLYSATVETSSILGSAYSYFLSMCAPGSAGTRLRLYAVSIGACVDPNLVVDAGKIDGGDDFTACETLETAGATQVSAGRNVKFMAGDRVVLKNGFEVHDGAVFKAQIGPTPPIPPLVIADFENGVPANWFEYGDFNGGVIIDITTPTIPDSDPLALPGQVGDNKILSVVADVPTWGGFGAGLNPVQDWSDRQSVGFWFYGENSGTTHEFEIQTAAGDDRRATFTDNFVGWRRIRLPFIAFGAGGAWDLSQVDDWVFILDGTVSSFHMDDLSVYIN